MTIRDGDKNVTQVLSEKTFRVIENKLGAFIYGKDHETMESVVGSLLLQKNKQFSVAESCTGGLISHLLTSVAGSSTYYLGGVTSYANSMKTNYLGVKEALLQRHGAVSVEVAKAMALGMRERSRADISLSVTGLAGPDGGSDEKPVGTVFIGIAGEVGVHVQRFIFFGDRHEIQRMTAQTALDLVRRYLLQN